MQTQIWQTFQDQDVIVFGINVDEAESVVEDFINEFQITFPVLLGTAALQNQYELASNSVAPYPRDFIIGRDGLFAYVSDFYDPDAMIEVIENELNITSVNDDLTTRLPEAFSLLASYPNPFSTTENLAKSGQISIVYQLNVITDVNLQIYDIRGRLVRTLLQSQQNPGEYTMHWDGRTKNNVLAAAGIYFVRLQANNLQQVQRISLIH